jgi:hypothetical protein
MRIAGWRFQAVRISKPTEEKVNAALTEWAAAGWGLVNASYGGEAGKECVWLFWRAPIM